MVIHTPRIGRILCGWIAALVVALLLADTAAWWIATSRLDTGLQQFRDRLGPSWALRTQHVARTGWPLAAELRLTGTELGSSAANGARWTAPRVVLGIRLWHPATLRIAADGSQTVQAPGLGRIGFAAGDLVATAPLAAPIRHVLVQARALRLALPPGPLVIDSGRLSLDWSDAAAGLDLSAGPATLPPGTGAGLGRAVTLLQARLVAHGEWPGGPPDRAATAWRDAGGLLDIAHLALRWGALNATGQGTLRLDGTLQPAGSLDVRAANPVATVAAMEQSGSITANQATAATALLSLLQIPARLSGQGDMLSLPLELQQGQLRIGAFPLARIPQVHWQ